MTTTRFRNLTSRKILDLPALLAHRNAARAAGKTVDFKVYPGAGHGFASLPDSRAYRPTQARDADARVNAFLEKRLKRS